MILIAESPSRRTEYRRYLGNAGQDNFFVNCLFIGTTFKRLRIRGCSFLNCYMLHCLFEDTYVHVSSFDKCMDKTKYANVGVHLYQQLMRNFKAIDQPDFFNEADFKFIIWKRYEFQYKVRNKKLFNWSVFVNYCRIILNFLFQWAFGYGIRFRNLVRATFLLILLFGAINYYFWANLGLSVSCDVCEGRSGVAAFYFTIISLSNLGYGDIVPITVLGRLWSSIQAIIGVIWFAIVASMIFKKFTR